MTKNSNQNIEKRYFEMFQKVYPMPPGKVNHGDRPDIIIEGKKRLGIEMTNFYIEDGDLPESEQTQIKLREKIVSDSQRLYLDDGGRNIGIVFGFDKENPIRDKGKLVNKLVDLAKRIENLETGSMPREVFRMIPELSFVYLNAQYPKWWVQQVYRGRGMSINRLIKIVREKEEKAINYMKCDAYWLLVVIEFYNPAQDQEIRIADIEKIKSDIFEKIIVFKTGTNEILEIK